LFVAPKPPPPPNREGPPVVGGAPKPDEGLDPKRPPAPEPPKGVEAGVAVVPPVVVPAPKPPKPPVPVPAVEPKRPVPEVPAPKAGLFPKAVLGVDPKVVPIQACVSARLFVQLALWLRLLLPPDVPNPLVLEAPKRPPPEAPELEPNAGVPAFAPKPGDG
jgi:hypothetical protein